MKLDAAEQWIRDLIEPVMNEPFYKYSIQPIHNLLPNLTLNYPGKANKNIRGLDYLMIFNGRHIFHVDIAQVFSDLANTIPAEELVDFIVDIYENGLEANHKLQSCHIRLANQDISWEEFKNVIFYIVIQENLNYPPPRYWGIKMPFIRYIEAVLTTTNPKILTFEVLRTRISGGNRNRINNLPIGYMNAINRIINS